MNLTPDKVKKLNKKGRYADREGLYLQVANNGTKTWIYRYQLNGKRRELGLGSIAFLSLSKARSKRDEYRLKVKGGVDPYLEKESNKLNIVIKEKEEAVRRQTFKKCAETYIDLKEPEWKNVKHAQQWRNTLKTYAYPIIGNLPVADVELQDVLKVIQPMWLEKTETATRVRNRIELVIDYASVMQYRTGENPARWRGNLDKLLPKPSKVKNMKHHSALPYDETASFMISLGAQKGLAAKALIFTILTATRTSEALNTTWDEVNLQKKVWVIPSSRMKAGKEHRIPLSSSAVALLNDLKTGQNSPFIFPGMKNGKPLSNMAMTNVLRRMERADLTVHGFRSTFRDWIAERTNFPQRVAETALAHKLKDGAEAAYQRGDLLEKRKELMEAWADYCLPKASNVTRIRA